ncbi:RDD family protein [Schlesneria paludicola]|uniref:RDD family protein n=1 Tax=Schlesneria paludicola TaxID=360056 RepID=UPI0004924A20|nr:RDD family protein [Schlesneria paludicola]
MSETTLRPRPVGWWSVITLLSLILPGAIVWWSVSVAMSGTPLRQMANRIPMYSHGWIRNGELWFPAIQLSDEWWAGPGTPSSRGTAIRRLDLATGVEHDTGLEVRGYSVNVTWIKDELYASSDTAIYKQEGTSLRELAKWPTGLRGPNAMPFLYDGKLTTFVSVIDPVSRRPLESVHRLIHLVDGKWVDGAKFVLPASGRLWKKYSQQGRLTIVSRRSKDWSNDPAAAGQQSMLTVLEDSDGMFHLFARDHFEFGAYRRGFEFVSENDTEADGGPVSAMVPENAPPDVSGWEPIQPVVGKDYWRVMSREGDSIIFGGFSVSPSAPARFRCVRRHSDGRWDEVPGLEKISAASKNLRLIPGATDGEIILMQENQWHSAELLRVATDGSPPIQTSIPGDEKPYLKRWGRLLFSFTMAWLLHVGLVVGGACLLETRNSGMGYQFGNQNVALASIARRGAALALDLVLFAAIIYFSAWCVIWYRQPTFLELDDATFAGAIHRMMDGGLSRGWRGLLAMPALALTPISILLFGFVEPEQMIQVWHLLNGVLVDVSIVVIVLRHVVEGRTGTTPGKWLLGLRTVRSTLRPCGFARALVRNLMCWCDIPLFLSPWPAATSLLFSSTCQRLGDRLADTIVVQSSSLSGRTLNSREPVLRENPALVERL